MAYIHSFNCPKKTVDDLDRNKQYKTLDDIKGIDEAVNNSNFDLNETFVVKGYYKYEGLYEQDCLRYYPNKGWIGWGIACGTGDPRDFDCTETVNGYSPSLEYLLWTNECNICRTLKDDIIYSDGYLEVADDCRSSIYQFIRR